MPSFDVRSMTVRNFDECPYCHGTHIKRNGWEHHHQRWYCKDCHKSFSSRTGTILNSSKLKPAQIRRMVSLLSDGVLFHQVSHQTGVSIQTVCLWKRKLQALTESQENTVLSGKIWADHTYIRVPAKERSKERKRGLSNNLRQIALAIDDQGRVLAVLGGRGNVSASEAEKAFSGHIGEGSTVIHDEGNFGKAFSGSKEIAVNSKSKEAHRLLNPVNSLCFRVQRMFMVHLRIHPQNIQKYLDELVAKESVYEDKAFGMFLHGIDTSIFLSGISLRRRDISRK